jgi:hypothetical protein
VSGAGTPTQPADTRRDPVAALRADLAQAEGEHASPGRIKALQNALRAHEQDARDRALAEYSNRINAYAASALADTRLIDALADIAAASQQVRELAAEHNAMVDELTAQALELGAGSPGGRQVRVGPGWVSARHVVRKVLITQAMHAALGGNMMLARDAARLVTNAGGRPVR